MSHKAILRQPATDRNMIAIHSRKLRGNPQPPGAYYNVLFDYESLDRDALIQAVLQHREILEALLRRDRPAAERALVNHIRNNHPLTNRPISHAPKGDSLI
jgi:DNA-binding GntR family transcriptional regulator